MHYWDTYYSTCFTFLLLGLGIKNIYPISFFDDDISSMIQRGVCVVLSSLVGEILRKALLSSLYDEKISKKWFIHFFNGIVGWYLIANNFYLQVVLGFKFMFTSLLTTWEIFTNYN